MITYRKIGGIHWFAIGSWRISFCVAKNNETPLQRNKMRHRIRRGQAEWTPEMYADVRQNAYLDRTTGIIRDIRQDVASIIGNQAVWKALQD